MLISNHNQDWHSVSLQEATQALATAQKMHDDWLNYGLNFVDLYVEDIDSNWLEKWDEDEEITQTLLNFLESDDGVALSVRKRLGNQSLEEIVDELEDCFSITDQEDRHLAVMNILAGKESFVNSKPEIPDSLEQAELLYLAKDLIEKIYNYNPKN
jgi:hypothetical protein